MVMTTLAPQTMSRDGIDPTYSAANADGHEFANNGRTFFQAFNGGGSDIECTFATPGTVDGLAIAERVVDIAAGEDAIIGPFPPAQYNTDPGTTDTVKVTFEGVASLTVAAIVMPTQ